MVLRLSRNFSPNTRRQLRKLAAGLPCISLEPITITILPRLTAYRGELFSGHGGAQGKAVHAAAFIRARRIVLESELLQDDQKLRLILTHELFHFVWARLGNPLRASFSAILAEEHEAQARGALGESSAVEKTNLAANPARHWRSFACESFCDTAAWMYAGVTEHREFRLSAKWRRRRRSWFVETFDRPPNVEHRFEKADAGADRVPRAIK